MEFDRAFDLLIDREKGFQDDPRDRGNWTGGRVGVGELKGTKYGISAMTYPGLDIKALTLDDARAIYRRDFWDFLKLEQMPAGIRFDLFDTAVNSSPNTAAKLLQRGVGVKDDGDIGRITLGAVAALTGDQLDKKFNGQRLLYLADLKTWPDYGRGWVRRVARNLIED